MSQDAKEGYNSESPTFKLRQENIKEHFEGFQKTLQVIDNLYSNEPEKIARGLITLADLEEKEERGKSWTAEQRHEWLGRAAYKVTQALDAIGGEVINRQWTTEKTKKLYEIIDLARKGPIPPASPPAIKPPGGQM